MGKDPAFASTASRGLWPTCSMTCLPHPGALWPGEILERAEKPRARHLTCQGLALHTRRRWWPRGLGGGLAGCAQGCGGQDEHRR